MGRYAIVQNGVVVNVIEADATFAAAAGGIASETASPGDNYSNGQFERPLPQPIVPREVSMAQARIALSRAGVDEADVDALIDAMPDGQAKTEARIWWARSNVVRRDHAVVAMLAPALGLTSEQLDQLFITAGGIA